MTPSEFLTTLWGNPPPAWVLIWTLPGKNSTWFQDFTHVDRYVNAHLDRDIYTGVSAKSGSKFPSRHERCTNANAAGIPGLWADIDLDDDVHVKANLPETVEDALCALPPEYPPSIVVHSGHGLQCWWLFTRPWMFKDAHERHLARQLTLDWHGVLMESFRQHGYALDATHDLARVMRLPGTWNHKGPRKPVHVIQVSDFRWRNIPKLPHSQPAMQSSLTQASVPLEIGELNLDPEQPLPSICEVMLEHMEKFARTWSGNRVDFTAQSASEFDMSIAGNAVVAGCSDQEIAAMIIHWRKNHGFDLEKVTIRQDYIRRTIARARGMNYGQ